MLNISISDSALNYVRDHERVGRKPNLVIYRDIPWGSCTKCGGAPVLSFVPLIKISDREPNHEYFRIMADISGIPVWVERALIPKIADSNSHNIITFKKSLMKRLKLEIIRSRDIPKELS